MQDSKLNYVDIIIVVIYIAIKKKNMEPQKSVKAYK